MSAGWNGCKNILCIRPDNMGDVLMSSPAFRALKETFGCSITLLTSAAGAAIARLIPSIDEVITCNLPWVSSPQPDHSVTELIGTLKRRAFDGAVIFTVYSQNPLPSAMIAYLAGIPNRLAWCRENPYHLLDCWMPDPEPHQFIRHQVQRDLDLVASIGAVVSDDKLKLHLNDERWPAVETVLVRQGVDPSKPWIILHPGVSEKKREYPLDHWIVAGKTLVEDLGIQLVITGSAEQADEAKKLKTGIGTGAFSAAGQLDLEESGLLISRARLLISVNTITSHMASALSCPVLILYALTNPQHLPWRTKGKMLLYPVQETLRSRNELVRQVSNRMPQGNMVLPGEIVLAAKEILGEGFLDVIPELVALEE